MHFKRQYANTTHILYSTKLERISSSFLTAHRRENLGEPMRNMFRAINRLLAKHDDIQVIYPVHMNPAVREIADEILGGNDRVHLIEPLEVVDFHNFAARFAYYSYRFRRYSRRSTFPWKTSHCPSRHDGASRRNRSRHIKTCWNR